MAADNFSFKIIKFVTTKSFSVFKGETGMTIAVKSVGSILFMPVIIEKIVENCSSGGGNKIPAHFFTDKIA